MNNNREGSIQVSDPYFASPRVHASRKSKSCFPSQPEYSNNTTEANVEGCKLEQHLDEDKIYSIWIFFCFIVFRGEYFQT